MRKRPLSVEGPPAKLILDRSRCLDALHADAYYRPETSAPPR
jgi:hypothetical protein